MKRLSVIRIGWLCGLLLAVAVTTHASPLLEPQDGPIPAPLITWCATPPTATIESVSAGEACRLAPLRQADIHPGFDPRAFWLRLEWSNPETSPVERWLTVGHPRLAYVSLFVSSADGWRRSDIGNHTPRARRGRIERDFGVLPVSLAASSRMVTWLRVQSDTVIDLATTVWTPIDYMASRLVSQFWISLGLGGLLITILFSLLMLAMTRQWAYGFFAIGMSGPLINVSIISGLLQGFLWPDTWPLPSEIIAFSNLAGVLGYYGFMHAFLPQRARYRKTERFLKGMVLSTVLLLLFAILIDYGAVAHLWGFFMLGVVATAALLTYLAWRDGDRSAGILLIAFGIHLTLVAIRLLFTVGWLPWLPQVTVLGPWGLLLSAPVVLLGLVSRTRQLQGDLARAQTENATQLAFFAQLSHELRSPLDTILGNAQLLSRGRQGAAFTACLTHIFESSRHLLRMIDHLLDYARGLSGVIRTAPEPVDMQAFLRGIERTARLYAAKQDNRFEMTVYNDALSPENRLLELDQEHLRQVLDNLLNNAARHTREGLIRLDYRLTTQAGGRVRLDFSVADNGEGVAPDDLQRIFKPFERAGSPGLHKDKGVGLGLAIARQLTELQGGALSVESAPGQGARFRFWILARKLAAPANAADTALEGLDAVGYEGRRRAVLLVDDNADNRAILAYLLDDLGFTVYQANCGEQAVQRLQDGDPLDLVMTDQFMPNGNGWMVLQTTADTHPDVPVILLSAAPPSPPANWPDNSRFTNHFLRPLDHSKLLACMADLLELTWTATETGEEANHADPLSRFSREDEPKPWLKKPPAADLSLFSRLVETGQVTAIEKWAQGIQARDPDYAAFIEQVLSAVRVLDLQELESLAEVDGEAGSPRAT